MSGPKLKRLLDRVEPLDYLGNRIGSPQNKVLKNNCPASPPPPLIPTKAWEQIASAHKAHNFPGVAGYSYPILHMLTI